MDPADITSADDDSKIDFIVEIATQVADLLRDPTLGGQREIKGDERNTLRESYHEDLTTCINALASCAHYHTGIFDIISIASKLHEQAKDCKAPSK
jgi:hypothetical protein